MAEMSSQLATDDCIQTETIFGIALLLHEIIENSKQAETYSYNDW